MTATEFKKAVKTANQIFVSVVINNDAGIDCKITKIEAMYQAGKLGDTEIGAKLDEDNNLWIDRIYV